MDIEAGKAKRDAILARIDEDDPESVVETRRGRGGYRARSDGGRRGRRPRVNTEGSGLEAVPPAAPAPEQVPVAVLPWPTPAPQPEPASGSFFSFEYHGEDADMKMIGFRFDGEGREGAIRACEAVATLLMSIGK